MISGATRAFLPASTLAMKCPLLLVPIIVPPDDMIPSVRARSRIKYWPGGRRPSKPSLNPITSQPSFSAARATPRNTAFRPGQSPPLVRTPIRVFIQSIRQVLASDRLGVQLRPSDHREPSLEQEAPHLLQIDPGSRAGPRSIDEE